MAHRAPSDQYPAVTGSMGSTLSYQGDSNPSRNGYPPEMFQEKVLQEYLCNLCHRVLCKPMATDCGCRFCNLCIMQYISGAGDDLRCPGCDDHLEVVNICVDWFAKKQLQKKRISCENREYGCPETFRLDCYGEHLQKCQYYKAEECTNHAGAELSSSDVVCNLSEGCRQRKLQLHHSRRSTGTCHITNESFHRLQEELSTLAVMVPASSRYNSDKEEDQGRRSRPCQKKSKKDPLGLAWERSRSHSQDRQAEVGLPTDEEDEADEPDHSMWGIMPSSVTPFCFQISPDGRLRIDPDQESAVCGASPTTPPHSFTPFSHQAAHQQNSTNSFDQAAFIEEEEGHEVWPTEVD